MFIKHLIFILFLTLPALTSQSQDLKYAKKVVKKLASKGYHGRGYVKNGNKKAAKYISKQFKSSDLESYNQNYFQHFNVSINTFPSKLSLKINSITKKPGVDFLIDPGSPQINGSFKTITFPIESILNESSLPHLLSKAKNKFIIIPSHNPKRYSKEELKKINEFIYFIKNDLQNPAAGNLLLTKNKLTWTNSTTMLQKPTIILSSPKDSINTVEISIENKFIESYKTQNILGYIKGQNDDSLIILTAHYDHLGMMGNKIYFPGANDNASGVALLLNFTQQYQKQIPKYTTVFIAFGGEEIGLLGSIYFVEHPTIDLKRIKFLINLDIAGTGDDGIQVVNGTMYKDKFEFLQLLNTKKKLLPDVKIRGEACNSDHCPFHLKGIPAFFIYTLGGINAYHDVYDRYETLPFTQYDNYFRLLDAFLRQL